MSIFYISGVQGAGKTTLCNIITRIKKDLNYNDNIVTKDMDNFVHVKYDTHYFNKREFIDFMKEHKNKHIILCGLLGYLKHIKFPKHTQFKYIDLQETQLKQNCIYRFFNTKDIYNFISQPLFYYFKNSQEECSYVVEERFGKDLIYIERFKLEEIERYSCMEKLITDIFLSLNFKNIPVDTYIDDYLYRLNIKNLSVILLKIFITFFYFLPSYSMKKFRFNIWFPVFYFFFPSYKILDVLNLIFLFVIFKKAVNVKPFQSQM